MIDGEGVVRKAFPRVRVDGHAAQVLEVLQQLAGAPKQSRRGAR